MHGGLKNAELQEPKASERAVLVNGQTIRYITAGPVNDRMPLVLLHGLNGNIDSDFSYLISIMKFRQRVVALDLAEPDSDTFELEHGVAQLAAVLDQEFPDQPVSLLGYSLGAAIAVKAAADLRDRIANLILVAGWLKADTNDVMFHTLWRVLRDQNRGLEKDLFDFVAHSAPFMKARPPELVRTIMKGPGSNSFFDKQMELCSRLDLNSACASITAKTLVVGCAYDRIAPLYQSKSLFGAIEDARYAEIPCGHAVMHERAAELFQYVDRFTRDPAASAAGAILPALKP